MEKTTTVNGKWKKCFTEKLEIELSKKKSSDFNLLAPEFDI
jgi:hypothetical protein